MAEQKTTLETIYNVPLKVSAVLGTAEMTIEELLKCTQGTVIELDRQVGEAVDIYVNEKIVARGEIVLVDDKIGITLTEMVGSSS